MCWPRPHYILKITKPGKRIELSYDWSTDEYDCDPK